MGSYSQVKLKLLQCDTNSFIIVQDDGATAVPVFAYICTDDGGCTAMVTATTDCSATAILYELFSAK